MKSASSLKPSFDGFDSNGKPTGKKCYVCIHQFANCQFQGFFGEGALLICNYYNLEKCFIEENENRKQ